jgi:hypothetical protein
LAGQIKRRGNPCGCPKQGVFPAIFIIFHGGCIHGQVQALSLWILAYIVLGHGMK